MSGAQIHQQIGAEQVRSQAASADAVVVGEIKEIHPLPAASAYQVGRVSHHIPRPQEWFAAVVEVRDVIKGLPGKTVVVRFTTSQDVAWHGAPKLRVGQQAVFLLTLDKLTSTVDAAVSTTPAPAYTALRPGDVLSPTEAERVRSIVSGPSR